MKRAELITLTKKLSLGEKLFLISQLIKDISSCKIEAPKKNSKNERNYINIKKFFPAFTRDLKKLRKNSIKHLEEEWNESP